MNELQKLINNTQNDNTPINKYSRIVIEDEKSSKPLAVITNDSCELANGLRARLKPVYPKFDGTVNIDLEVEQKKADKLVATLKEAKSLINDLASHMKINEL